MSEMSDSIRWKIYASLAVMGFGLAIYLLNLVLQLYSVNGNFSNALIFSIAIVVLIVAGLVNSYIAYGFKCCRVDEVIGSRSSAVLIRSGKSIRKHVRIRFARNVDADNLSMTDDQRCVLFIGDWRPYVCSVQGFHCELY
jgi:hypothetical protein